MHALSTMRAMILEAAKSPLVFKTIPTPDLFPQSQQQYPKLWTTVMTILGSNVSIPGRKTLYSELESLID